MADGESFLRNIGYYDRQQTTDPPSNKPKSTINGHSPYGQAALDAEVNNVRTATKGGRNNALNRAMFNLASLIEAGHLDRSHVEQALTDAALTAGLTPRETQATINSAADGSARKVGARDITNGFDAQVIEVDDLAGDSADADPSGSDIEPRLEDIERDFWSVRPTHQLIFDAALSRMASPWAVMACVAARILQLVPPSVVLPPIIGGRGSLNWFGAISAKSGGGKGAAMAAASKLVDVDVNVRGIGSGEGMIEAYQRGSQSKKDPPSPITSVMFSIDEIDSLGAMGGRSGQTTMAILRQGFSGETLGYSYRGRQSETVAAHTYRMTVIASVQPERAGVLFSDAGGGTPQRFMWFPGRDKRIVADHGHWPVDERGLDRCLAVIPEHQHEAGVVTVPTKMRMVIKQARADSMNGTVEALDGHALFAREKFAYVLALLDGRTHINNEDWRLSGIAASVSDWTRTKTLAGWQTGKLRAARESGELRAIAKDEETIVAVVEATRHISRIVALIVSRIKADGPSTTGTLRRSLNSRDRSRFEVALKSAVESKIIVDEDGRWRLTRSNVNL